MRRSRAAKHTWLGMRSASRTGAPFKVSPTRGALLYRFTVREEEEGLACQLSTEPRKHAPNTMECIRTRQEKTGEDRTQHYIAHRNTVRAPRWLLASVHHSFAPMWLK